jgi:hypothetical protein
MDKGTAPTAGGAGETRDDSITSSSKSSSTSAARVTMIKKRRKKQPKSYQSQEMKNYLYGLEPKSREQYPFKLKLFFDFHKIGEEEEGKESSLDKRAQTFVKQAREKGISWVQQCIIQFIEHYRERIETKKDLKGGTLKNYFDAIKLFITMNDELIPDTEKIKWKRLSKGLPAVNKIADDRSPTKEEIRKIMECHDRRIRVIALFMCSSGMRLGAWDDLRLKHISPIQDEKTKELKAAKIMLYADDGEQYWSYLTPEAYHELEKYLEFRKSWGEDINDESPVIRNLFRTSNVSYKGKMGMAKYPKALKVNGVKKVIINALKEQGLRQGLPEGRQRYEFKATHGFRKYFETCLENARMLQMNVAKLMNHKDGMAAHYRRPFQATIMEEYLLAIDFLTIGHDGDGINDNKAKMLEKELVEVKEKTNEQSNFVLVKLLEKEKEMKEMQDKIGSLERNAIELSKSIIAERRDWVCIQDEKDPNALVVHVYDKALKSLRPVTIEEARKLGIKEKGNNKMELEPANNEPVLNIEHKGTIQEHNVFKIIH